MDVYSRGVNVCSRRLIWGESPEGETILTGVCKGRVRGAAAEAAWYGVKDMRRILRAIGSERGQGLVLGALALFLVAGFAALAIDVGQAMHERRELQKAADAAALAGAGELPFSAGDALSIAQEWAEKNGIDVAGELSSVEVTSTHAPNDTITVQVERDVPYVFARVLGFDSQTIHATATARVGSPAAMAGLRPFGVLESAIDYSGSTPLKYDAKTHTNGNFGGLALDGNGANVYRNTIKYGSDTPACAQGEPGCTNPTIETEPGNMIGPTRVGIQYLLDNASTACDEFGEVFVPDDSTPNPNDYTLTDGCNPFRAGGPGDSAPVIMTPVIDHLCSGRCDVTVLYFAMFFVEDLDSCTGNDCVVHGRFAKANVDVGGLIGSYDEDSAISFVRLVD